MKKTFFVGSMIFLLILLAVCVAIPVYAANDKYSGTCGESLTWELDTSTGELTISGNGEMKNYSNYSKAPWSGRSSVIKVVRINEGVASIGEEAFQGCHSLESIYIPSTIKKIGRDAFEYCSSISSVYITDLAAWCGIEFCNQLSTPMYERRGLYVNGALLTDLIIPEGTTSIAAYTFYGCDFIKSVTIPQSVDVIGSHAFYKCYGITELIIPEGVKYIQDNAFGVCSGLKSLVLPKSLLAIGKSAFEKCWDLESLVMNEGLTTIDERAFVNCASIKALRLPKSLVTVGDRAFMDCSDLREIHIGENLTSIGDSAFVGCMYLGSVHITDIGAWCRIRFETSYSSPLMYANNLYLNGEPVTEVVIPDGVSRIYPAAFSITGLTKIVIPASVMVIDTHAFYKCNNLEAITIPYGVERIEEAAFYGCSRLKAITISDSVDTICMSAFYECVSLTDLILGGRLSAIDARAFYGCRSLERVVIPENMMLLGEYAFAECKMLKTVDIKGDIYELAPFAFLNCTLLDTVYLPKGLSKIHNGAFYNCGSLKRIVYAGTSDDWKSVEVYSQWENDTIGATLEFHVHSFGEYFSNGRPFCSEVGTKTATCSICGASDTVIDTEVEPRHRFSDGRCIDCGVREANSIGFQIFAIIASYARIVVGAVILIGWFLVGKDKKRYY